MLTLVVLGAIAFVSEFATKYVLSLLGLLSGWERVTDALAMVTLVLVALYVITHERRRRERELRGSEERLRTVIAASKDAMVAIDSHGRIILFNPAAEQMFGRSAAEMLGQPLDYLMPEEYRARHRQYLESYFRCGTPNNAINRTVELPACRRDGRVFPVELSLSVGAHGAHRFVLAVLRDITARKAAEEALHKAHTETRQVLSAIPSILIGANRSGLITKWNEAAQRTFGISAESAAGRGLHDPGVSWDGSRVAAAVTACRDTLAAQRLDDVLFRRCDGRNGFLALTINPVLGEAGAFSGFLLVGEDISERRALEYQLAQVHKLEAIGQLAAGIAHEINTPTQFVGDNTRFLQDAFAALRALLQQYGELLAATRGGRVTPQLVAQVEAAIRAVELDYLIEEIPKAIEQTLEGVRRVAQIVLAMKDFSHPGGEEREAVDINRAIESTIMVARNEWKHVAEVIMDLAPDLPSVPGLPGDLNQVILNVLVNATHAIADVVGDGSRGRGTITVQTRREGEWVEIRIGDTGTGIPEAVRGRIFEPFFTTKEVGKGTGQGLAIAHTVVVRKHGGTITFETETGRGTTFIIRLPLAPVPADDGLAIGDGGFTESPPSSPGRQPLPTPDPRAGEPREQATHTAG